MTPLHDYINTANHLCHLGYHYNSRLKLPKKRIPPRGAGKRRTEDENKAIKESTKEFKNEIWHGPASIPADQPDPTGAGGNTTTGNIAKRLLEPEKRQHIVALFKFDLPNKAEQLGKLLQSISVILSILSSWRKQIRINEFELFVKKTHLQLYDMFPWM